MDHLKHILAGGFWKEGESWIQAGDNVLQVLQTETIIQCHLGWVPPQQIVLGTSPTLSFPLSSSNQAQICIYYDIGSIHLASKVKNPPQPWVKTLTSMVIDNPPVAEVKWQTGVTVIVQSGDKCFCNSWIFLKQGVHCLFQCWQ